MHFLCMNHNCIIWCLAVPISRCSDLEETSLGDSQLCWSTVLTVLVVHPPIFILIVCVTDVIVAEKRYILSKSSASGLRIGILGQVSASS